MEPPAGLNPPANEEAPRLRASLGTPRCTPLSDDLDVVGERVGGDSPSPLPSKPG